MKRVPLDDLREGERHLDGDAGHYLTRVHRMSAGTRFVVFDPEARLEAQAEVLNVSGSHVRLRLDAPRASQHLPRRAVTVVQALAKASKLDAIVRDATELGATRFVPVRAERSVKAHANAKQLERWRRIALEAARQAGRGDVMNVVDPTPLSEALEAARGAAGVALLLHPRATTTWRDAVEGLAADAGVALAIGPEGGFSDEEIALAEAIGFRTVALGRFTMRTETACAAALGALVAFDG